MAIRIVIVGGVAGGATAAAKARRADEFSEITLLERGPYISFANCGLPYYIAGEITDRAKLLVTTPEAFAAKYRVDVRTRHEVIGINREARYVTVQPAHGDAYRLTYDRLILSQGAQPLRPPMPGIEQDHVFTLRDIPNVDAIEAYLARGTARHAVVIGGGFIGLEMAEAFYHRGLSVTVVEKLPTILPVLDADIGGELQGSVARPRFAIRSGVGVTAIGADSVTLEDGDQVPADLVLVSIGVRPEVALARDAGLTIGVTGGVVVDEQLRTSDPAIFAVGDAAETVHVVTGAPVRIPLAGPANRQGRIAGSNAAGSALRYRGALGTAIVRVLDQVAGATGLSSRQAKMAGYTIRTSVTRDNSHAGYYPGATSVVTKLVFDAADGRILGAQFLGQDGVDKRLDVIATAIHARMTVDDLATLDLAYAPPFGSANDPVNVAGFVASHIAHGEVAVLTPEDGPEAVGDALLLDVRNPDELQRLGTLVGARNLPLPQLRDSLRLLPKDRPIAVFCQKGARGYLAYQILAANGFTVRNLAGGFLQARANKWPIETYTPAHSLG